MQFLLTTSLLNAWIYSFTNEGYADFLRILKRESMPQSKAMLEGIQFENMISAWNEGFKVDEKHELYKVIKECADILKGSQEQVKLYKDYKADDIDFLLYGRLDNLKRGIIYDTKFSKSYYYGRYWNCPQHSMYFELCPEANKFIYIVSDGKDVYKEEYRRFDFIPINAYIKPFIRFLEQKNLKQIYFEKWKSKNQGVKL